MAGTISVCVTRSRCISAMNGSALNAGTMTVVPPTCSIVAMIAIRPVTWLAGTASADTSPSRSFMQAWKCSTECTMFRCVSIAPFGLPVVPEV